MNLSLFRASRIKLRNENYKKIGKFVKSEENSHSKKNYKIYQNCEKRNEIRFVEGSEQNCKNYENREISQSRQRKSKDKYIGS